MTKQTPAQASVVEKAAIRHDAACVCLEKAQDREHKAYQILKEAIEAERQAQLDIYRPEGCIR